MKNITNNARENNQVAILHLFEFDMYDFNNTFLETLRFTDHDIFVNDGTNEYTPLAITFDTLKEDITMQTNSVNVMLDNVSGAISSEAIAVEWRNNRAAIKRVIYIPKQDIIGSDTYEFGYGDNMGTYPVFNIADVRNDQYVLFEGIIDTFNASEQSLNGSITTLFVNWTKAYPPRTFNQNEFASIVNAMTDSVYWGRNAE